MFKNSKTRMEAISDGVFAVVLTIMVLDIKVPAHFASGHFGNLPIELVVYLISFAMVAQYWVYHQEALAAIKTPATKLLVYNFYYLCFVSLTPFATSLLTKAVTARLNTFTFALAIVLVDTAQFMLYHAIMKTHQAAGQRASMHDLEEYRSVFIMFLYSFVILAVAGIYPKALLIAILLEFCIRFVVVRYHRRHI